MDASQGDAVLDVWDGCIGVSYAYRQCAYHNEHLASRTHDQKCKLAQGEKSRCQRMGEKTQEALVAATEQLQQFYKTAFELDVEEALLDTILYDLLPQEVFKHIYEESP